jgi:ATPase family AAA domain-containing protein 3A/B
MQTQKSQSDIALMRARWEEAGKFFAGEEGRQRFTNTGLLGASLIGTFFVGKSVYPVVKRGLRDFFFRPRLLSKFEAPPASSVFAKPLQAKLDTVVAATQTTWKRGGYFGHLLLHGQPGTGKTLFARQLALASGMEFAMLSGPAFDQFDDANAIIEIKSLFSWANRSKKGLLLFVDEAESFLEDRRKQGRSKVLNEWISHTGTETRRFMTVYATNRPEVLDSAVVSRVTRAIHIPAPGASEIAGMLRQFWKRMLPGVVWDASVDIDAIARDLHEKDFVGRDVVNLTISLQQALAVQESVQLTAIMVAEAVEEIVQKKHILVSIVDSKQ